MLKKLFITMLVGMMTLGAMAQGGKFTVKGTFEGRKDSVTLEVVDLTNWETIVKQTYAIKIGEVPVRAEEYDLPSNHFFLGHQRPLAP